MLYFTEETITLEAGPLEQFSHAIEPQLRQLGMFPTLFSSFKTWILDKDSRKGSCQFHIFTYIRILFYYMKFTRVFSWFLARGVYFQRQ